MRVLIALAVIVAATPIQRGNDPLDRAIVSTDVGWLELLASGDAAGAEANVSRYFSPKKVRQVAFLRLGELGTRDALAAIRRVEGQARTWSLVPETVSLDRMPHPSGHFGDERREPFAQVTAPTGVTYALIQLDRLGGIDAFLIWSRTPQDRASWSRPVLVPDRFGQGIADPRLTWVGDGDKIRLDFMPSETPKAPAILRTTGPMVKLLPAGPQSITLSPSALTRDADGDGWTDIEERRLGTNVTKADSDGDGIADGVDTCPTYAATPFEADDVEATILRKVFFAGFGIYGSPSLYMVGPGSRPLQLWGSRAPVIYADRTEWINQWGGAPPRLSWRVTFVTTDGSAAQKAIVEFGDYVGGMAAAGYTATLNRIGDEWVVVKIAMNWIS